ncbi:hypothetical protein CW304_23280 [Bacillus sp. UFRGS-B20]|nr:hypothetical protein CW304_23280 [Bacillus sp. UFRGS-B20]
MKNRPLLEADFLCLHPEIIFIYIFSHNFLPAFNDFNYCDILVCSFPSLQEFFRDSACALILIFFKVQFVESRCLSNPFSEFTTLFPNPNI